MECLYHCLVGARYYRWHVRHGKKVEMRIILKTRFVLILTGVLWLVMGAAHAASMTAHELLAEHLAQQLARERPGNPIERHPFETAHLTMVIRDRIDARLLGEHPHIEATDLRFAWPDDKHAVAIITLTYSTPAIALRQSEWLVARTHFQRSKILTPFSYAVVDETLVILFTEGRFGDFIEAFVQTLKAEPPSNPPVPFAD